MTLIRTQDAMWSARGFSLPAGNVILCADDFAISDGVSRGIEHLALQRRLSATSAIVTLPTWPTHAVRLAKLRPSLAVGLHVNLTLGAALGAMPSLAPSGRLPSLGALVQRALTFRIDGAEAAAEIDRQLAVFEAATGFAPDFVDGHQHVHALPGVRTALLQVLTKRFTVDRRSSLLVRDPADRLSAITARRASAAKALVIAGLSLGFGTAVRRAGFRTNVGFSGVSAFDTQTPYAHELSRFFAAPGVGHLVMCHPGYPDAELAKLDPHTERRRQELDAIQSMGGLVEAIWHVDRRAEPDRVVWPPRPVPGGQSR